MDLDKPTTEFVGSLIAGQGAASFYLSAAIVMALAARGVVDPLEVAKNAEFFSAGQPGTTPPDVRQHVAEQLGSFAAMMRSMATIPPNAGRG